MNQSQRCPACSEWNASTARTCAACGLFLPDDPTLTILPGEALADEESVDGPRFTLDEDDWRGDEGETHDDLTRDTELSDPLGDPFEDTADGSLRQLEKGLGETFAGLEFMGLRAVGQFQILEKLGSGGMGSVYLARDNELGRQVALKVFRASMQGRNELRDMLLEEAKMAGGLNHPNIITIYDVARDRDKNYIAMEYIDGRPLKAMIPEHGLHWREAANLALSVARGIAAAHERGIVHRDLKPANVMVGYDGQVKVLDFGLASFGKQITYQEAPGDNLADEVTRDGPVQGTVFYMSPEQARGELLDVRSDIFSFGVMFYEMLVGKRPFRGATTREVFDAIFEENPKPLFTFGYDIPTELVDLVDNTMAKPKTNRLQSMREVVRQLERLLEEEGAHEREIDWEDESEEPREMLNGRMVTLALLVAMIVSGAFVLSITDWQRGAVFEAVSKKVVQEEMKLAVLPFQNQTDNPLSQAFVDGLGTTLSRNLAKLEGHVDGLWVLGMDEIQRQGIETVADVRRRTRADRVLTGYHDIEGSRHRLRLILLRPSDQTIVGERELSVDENQLFQMQQEAIEAVADLLDWDLPRESMLLLTEGRLAYNKAYLHHIYGEGYLYRYGEEHGLLDQAMESFEQALALEPNFVSALIGKSQAALKMWERNHDAELLEVAENAARKAHDLNPNVPASLRTIGEVYAARGQHHAAINRFQQCLELDPHDVEAKLLLAETFLADGQEENALSYLNLAKSAHPNNWKVLNQLGTFHWRAGDFEAAALSFRELIAMAPRNVIAHRNLAGALAMQKKYMEAARRLYKGIELAPESSTLHANLGAVLMYAGRHEEAAEIMCRAVALNPLGLDEWSNLAEATFGAGDRDHAREAYRCVQHLAESRLGQAPHDLTALARRLKALVRLGRCDQARRELPHWDAADLEAMSGHEAFEMVQSIALVAAVCGDDTYATQILALGSHELGLSPEDIAVTPEFQSLWPRVQHLIQTR